MTSKLVGKKGLNDSMANHKSPNARASTQMETARAAIRSLIAQFRRSESHYMSSDYQEAEVRKDFIDKTFSAIGWDVDHVQQPDPYRQEVKIERSGKKHKGRADYAFSIAPAFQRVRFFVEAKRPQPSIVTPDNCFQIIRYSWPSGLPLGVLTDFRTFQIVDTRFRPNIATATSRVVRTWNIDDLENDDLFAEFYWLLSREAVSDGSIARFAEDFLPDPAVAQLQYKLFPGDTRDFDDDFLAKMGEWRQQLAMSFVEAAPRLSGQQITEAVQRTIDRLIFIRFLEDKQIEAEPIVGRFAKSGGAWRGFVRACRRLDGIYNGILFKHHSLLDSLEFAPRDAVFVDICDELSDQHSPYSFAAIPIEILGRIYETFLGSVVVKVGRGVEITEKASVRKAGGVFYTPQYVVDYMVSRSIGPALDGKAMSDILAFRVIDTSCGSGSFLIGVFEHLMRTALAILPAEGPRVREKYLVMRDGEARLTMRAKREILQNCIYGVDIDNQAVEVAQVSLFLKLLSDETTYSAQHQQLEMGAALLPSLSANVIEGNSLVTLSGELFDAVTMSQVKALDFHSSFAKVFDKGGFDLVIGNPPYVKEYTNRDAFENTRNLPYYQGKMDLWYMFACRGIDWLKDGGRLAFIATNNWTTNAGASNLRRKVAEDTKIEVLVDFGRYMIFSDASIQTMILIAVKSQKSPNYTFELRRLIGKRPSIRDVHGLLSGEEAAGREFLKPNFDRKLLQRSTLTFANVDTEAMLARIAAKANFQLDGRREVAQGIVPNVDVVTASGIERISDRARVTRGISVGDGVFVVPADQFRLLTTSEKRFLKPCYEPSDVGRFAIRRKARLKLIYSKRDVTEHTPLPERFLNHLHKYREIMAQRRETLSGQIETHHLHWPRDERFFQKGPKILSVRKAAVPTFAYTDSEAYVMMAFNVIRTDRVQMLYLTGLLNSAVIKFWLRHRGKMQGGNFQIDKEPLLALPLHAPPDAEQKYISNQVAQVIAAIKLLASAQTDSEVERFSRLRREAEEKVESSIAGLYGFNAAERELIEKSF